MEQLLSCIQQTSDTGIWKKLVWSTDRQKFNEATVDSVDRSIMVILETMMRLGKLPNNIELKQFKDGIYFRFYDEFQSDGNPKALVTAEPVMVEIF